MCLIKPSRFSLKIIWLELTSTNNDPSVVVKFCCDAVVKLEGMPHALRAYACTVLHINICVCLYVSSCCLSVQLRTCMRLTVVICRHSVKVPNGPRKYLGPIGKPAIGVLTESQLRHNMPWLEMYMKLLLLRHITELEVSMMYSTQHCTLELQRKTTTQCVIKRVRQVHCKLEKYTALLALSQFMSRKFYNYHTI